jgi:hypothetical protein
MCKAMLDGGGGIASRSACHKCGCKLCALAWELTGLQDARKKGAGMSIRFGVIQRHGFCVTFFGGGDHDIYLYARAGQYS